ncbi:MAPEG family protein [Asticcacaulis solisilvae]|uniref:MAPEG family protein n=1 Tax=Asticcacaulis solisilvae TaxID=1217274 RepID=UPI003FD84A71
MTEELRIAVYAAGLGIFQLLLAAEWPLFTPGYMKWNAGPRDKPFETGAKAGRLKRAFANFMETYVFFAVIVVALAFMHKSDALSLAGAWTYLIARIVYVPLYAFAVTYVRSLVWIVSLAGILMTACSLLF